ncbi:DUF305 domain-containing protein [soil metagenome]
MHRATLITGSAVTAITLALAGCSSSTSAPSAETSSAATATAASSSTAAPAAASHNQADVDFAQHMIPHHQQAVEMSDMLLGKQGIDPQVVALANQIKAAQGPEITTMQGWLTAWGAPTPTAGSAMPGKSMPAMAPMPGMMTDQDMAALQNAQGAAASKTFLTGMIQHHQGAIDMARTEIAAGQNPDAVALAKSISTSQQQEITTMQGLLKTL